MIFSSDYNNILLLSYNITTLFSDDDDENLEGK